MCASIAFGLLQINSMDGEHRNMKPNNILVQNIIGLNYLILTDSGSSKSTLKFDPTKGNTTADMLYCSPERVNNYTNIYKEDVWALGVILYQMSSFEHPFNLE